MYRWRETKWGKVVLMRFQFSAQPRRALRLSGEIDRNSAHRRDAEDAEVALREV
jgi:hypothetical protein